MIKESDIVIEKGKFWVFKAVKGRNAKFNGYQIQKDCGCYSERVGIVGLTGEEGLKRAKIMLNYHVNKFKSDDLTDIEKYGIDTNIEKIIGE